MITLYEFERQGVTVSLMETDDGEKLWEVTCEHCGDQSSGLDFDDMGDVRYEHLDGCAGGDNR